MVTNNDAITQKKEECNIKCNVKNAPNLKHRLNQRCGGVAKK